MARTNGVKTETIIEEDLEMDEAEEETIADSDADSDTAAGLDTQDIEDSLNALKTLLTTVEKLQKVRQEVGDVRSLLLRMLDGEVMSGDDLEQLKVGVGGLSKLVRAYSDHQVALAKAQSARDLLDEVLRVRSPK